MDYSVVGKRVVDISRQVCSCFTNFWKFSVAPGFLVIYVEGNVTELSGQQEENYN